MHEVISMLLQDLMADIMKHKEPAQSPLQDVIKHVRATVADLPANEPHWLPRIIVSTRKRATSVHASGLVRCPSGFNSQTSMPIANATNAFKHLFFLLFW
jgi:hypothetical protein